MTKKKKNNTAPAESEVKKHKQAPEAPEKRQEAEILEAKQDHEAPGPETAEAPGEPKEVDNGEQLKKEVEQLNDKYLRLFAEFENYKRRKEKERVELINTASKSVLLTLLPVLDDLDRARKSMESANDVEAVKEGVDLINTKFRKILDQQGLKEMEAIGEDFNPDLHEAVTNIPAPSEEMKGKVVDQVEKGYYLNEKVIRFAKVIVGA